MPELTLERVRVERVDVRDRVEARLLRERVDRDDLEEGIYANLSWCGVTLSMYMHSHRWENPLPVLPNT